LSSIPARRDKKHPAFPKEITYLPPAGLAHLRPGLQDHGLICPWGQAARRKGARFRNLQTGDACT